MRPLRRKSASATSRTFASNPRSQSAKLFCIVISYARVKGMSKLRQSPRHRFFAVLALATLSLGTDRCGGLPMGREGQPCDAGAALISIWDGKIQKNCHCGGVDGEFAAPNTALTCTFSISTVKTLFISYQGTFLRHQFKSVGTPSMPNGPLFDRSAKAPIRSHAVSLTAAGTYQFQDEFDATIFGSIIATP